MRASPLKVVVIGGGITGLAAAYELARARQSGAPVCEVLLESGARVGGLIHTEQVDGFTVEAGPDSFLSGKMKRTGLLAALGMEDRCIASNDAARRTWILWRGRLEPLPEGLQFFVPTRLSSVAASRLIPFSSKLAILRDFAGFARPASLPPGGEESAADFVRRHLGEGVLKSIADPLLAGVYGGDSEQLSAAAVLPSLVEIERKHGSLVRGMIKMRNTFRSSAPLFSSPQDGLEDLPRALRKQIELLQGANCRIRLQCSAASLEAQGERYSVRCENGETLDADAVILSLPAPACARILRELDAALADELAGIPYTPAVIVALGYAQAPALPPGFGFLVPRSENRALLACTMVHAKFSRRAPPGAALLRCFMGGAHHPEAVNLSDEELLARALRDLREIAGVEQPPAFHHIYRLPRAMPQYTLGHEMRAGVIRARASLHPGLFLAGNAYQGVGIPDCIASAQRAVQQALEYASARLISAAAGP